MSKILPAEGQSILAFIKEDKYEKDTVSVISETQNNNNINKYCNL
jgi:hypothetical protein